MILLCAVGLSSCGIYRQNVVNVPLMQQKHQTQLGAHIGFTGYDGQASYALTNHIGLLANYSDLGTKRVSFSTVNRSIDKHNFGEAGAGYYAKNKTGWTYEFFILAGTGMSSHFVTGGDTIAGHTQPFTNLRTAHYDRFVLQADLGKSTQQLRFAFTPRIFFIHYYNIRDTETDRYKNFPSTYLYADLAVTLQYKLLKYLMVSTQVGLTAPITGFKVGYYESSPFNCSLGLILNMNFFSFSDKRVGN